MAFRPNYRQERAQKSRAKEERKQEKLKKLEEASQKRKAMREAESGADPAATAPDDGRKDGRVGRERLLDIYVDADACPVKREVERVADRHDLAVTMVSNGGMRPSAHPRFRNVTVGGGADAADDWIAGHIGAFDIAVTADVPLASRCLEKGASAIGPSGKLFTQENIGMALGMRDLNRYLREATGQQTFHSGFTKQDRSRFLAALENEIAAVRQRMAVASACDEQGSPR